MPQKKGSQVPAYQKIQLAIRKRIESGLSKAGDAVESERELAKIHQVSLMTARHALASLEREGLVERRRGIGTFVGTPKIQFNKLLSFTEQLAGRGLVASSKILVAGVVCDEPEVSARLLLPPDAGMIKLERLRHAAEQPFSLETCYLAAADFPNLLQAPLSRESLFQTLERKYNVTLGHADEEVDATAADARTAELLSIPRRSPVLRIRQLIYSTKEKPLIYVLGFYRPDRHNFVTRRFRESV